MITCVRSALRPLSSISRGTRRSSAMGEDTVSAADDGTPHGVVCTDQQCCGVAVRFGQGQPNRRSPPRNEVRGATVPVHRPRRHRHVQLERQPPLSPPVHPRTRYSARVVALSTRGFVVPHRRRASCTEDANVWRGPQLDPHLVPSELLRPVVRDGNPREHTKATARLFSGPSATSSNSPMACGRAATAAQGR